MSKVVVIALAVCLLASQGTEPTRFTLTGRDFEVTRALLSGGDVEVTVAGGGELIPLVIRIGGPKRLRISRADHVVWGLWELGRVKSLADGRAVASFRERVGEYERAFIAGRAAAAEDDEPTACGFVLAGALVSALTGDPAAGSRARDVVMRRLDRRSPESSEPGGCAGAWNRGLAQADAGRAAGIVTADGRDGWSERTAERTLCEAEFLAAFTAAEVRVWACRGAAPAPQK